LTCFREYAIREPGGARDRQGGVENPEAWWGANLVMAAAILTPFFAWALLLAFLYRKGLEWRDSFLSSAVVWGGLLVLSTEILSLFSALNRGSLTAFWTSCAIVEGLLVFRAKPIAEAQQPAPKLSAGEKLSLAAICGILAGTLLIAIVSPPNTWDSLVYHMTRVMFWIQNGSVAHFATNNLRQIELNPFAEFAILHLQLLSGGDRFANLVQWFSFAGCIVGVSCVAELLGATRRAQILSALVAATIPMAVLQASSTQNDLVASLWLVCFAAFGLRWAGKKSLWLAVVTSLSLGLAVLTKGTAYFFAFPFVVWIIARDLRVPLWRSASTGLALALVVLALNAGHYGRNYRLFGHPLHSREIQYGNYRPSPAVVLSNMSRNVALHLMTPWPPANRAVIKTLASFHDVIGIRMDAPETTWPGTSPTEMRFSVHEDFSGNLVHVFLFLGTALLIASSREHRGSVYLVLVLAGCLLFCSFLRWQPWASRLQLPSFILFSPVAALAFDRIRRRWAILATLVLLAGALPYVLSSYSRPIVPRSGTPFSVVTAPRSALYLVNKPKRGLELLAAAERSNSAGFRN